MKGKYFIHDTTRGYVGNCMVWWKADNHGYTCDVGQARIFDESELPDYLEAGDLVAYPVDHIRDICIHHVDMQRLDRSTAVRPAP